MCKPEVFKRFSKERYVIAGSTASSRLTKDYRRFIEIQIRGLNIRNYLPERYDGRITRIVIYVF